MDNIYLFEECLKIWEPCIDEYYFTWLDDLFIDNDDVVEKIWKLRSLITACYININKNISFEYLLDDILDILEENVKYSEFVAFWKVLDISYSSFSVLKIDQKKEILKKFIFLYCKNREFKYIEKWIVYSNSTIQALYDSWSSRSKWELGKKKLIDFLKNKGITEFFVDEQKIKNEISKNDIKFEFSNKYQWKLPDAFFYNENWEIFILEAKHINEWGWSQDKQVHELIDFISYTEENVHYVSFLDWTYFNKFKNIKNSSKKLLLQKQQILNNLNKNKNNYFINTYWLEKLF